MSSKSHYVASHITKDEIPEVILNATSTSTVYTEEKACSCCLKVIPDVSAWATVLDSGLLKGKTPSW
jgi:hypothetical protein